MFPPTRTRLRSGQSHPREAPAIGISPQLLDELPVEPPDLGPEPEAIDAEPEPLSEDERVPVGPRVEVSPTISPPGPLPGGDH